MFDKSIITATLLVALLLIPVFKNGEIVMNTIYGVGDVYINSTKEIAIEIGDMFFDTKDYYAEITDKMLSTYIAIGKGTMNLAYSSINGVTELGHGVLIGIKVEAETMASLANIWSR